MRGWRLSIPPQAVHLYRKYDAPRDGAPLAGADAASRVRAWMELDSATLTDIHDTLALSPARAHRGTRRERDALVVRALESAFRRGELVAIPIAFRAVWVPIERIEEPSLGPETTTSEEAPKDFFSATVTDANGKPAAGVKYKLRTPDGRWREGKTDDSGKIRVDDIDRGYCELSFHPAEGP